MAPTSSFPAITTTRTNKRNVSTEFAGWRKLSRLARRRLRMYERRRAFDYQAWGWLQMQPVPRQLFADHGITYVAPAQQRGRIPLTTCCGPFIDRLIARHGVPHVAFVLKTIMETDGNAGELIADTIGAVSDIVLLHLRWAELGGAWLETFDQINLAKVRRIAKASRVRPLKSAIAAIIHLRLEEVLGSSVPKPEKVARLKRAPKPPYRRLLDERRLALGRELMALRSKARGNREYGRLRRRHSPDIEPKVADAAVRVAKVYGDKPAITARTDWKTLTTLASPRLPAADRQRFEARILSGERVLASEIRRARGCLPSGRPRRHKENPEPLRSIGNSRCCEWTAMKRGWSNNCRITGLQPHTRVHGHKARRHEAASDFSASPAPGAAT
jgi:hypothetical protein